MGDAEADVSKVVQLVTTMAGVQLEPGMLYYSDGKVLSNN